MPRGSTTSTATRLNAANEIEGFLFAGVDAEKRFPETAALNT